MADFIRMPSPAARTMTAAGRDVVTRMRSWGSESMADRSSLSAIDSDPQERIRVTTSRPAAVIVLAAGEGIRMKSAIPKVLHSIGGRTLLGHAIAAARGVDPQHLAIVVRHGRDLVAAHIAQIDPDAVIADQDEVKGTGRATECALDALPLLME